MSSLLGLLLAMLTAAGQGLVQGAPLSGTRPNIIFIIADDMAWNDCGAYGNSSVRTPSLNRLAHEGMRFTRAFLTTSSCSPSRSSIITGRYPHNTDAEQLHWPLPGAQVTFVEKLKAAGYWTAAAGKWHLGNAVKDRFDVVAEAGTAGFQLPSGEGNKMIAAQDESGCENWLPLLMGRPRDKPFFLWLAALDPHRDYRPDTIPNPHAAEDVVVPPYLPDKAETRADLARYYDEITRMDGYVGRVLDELRAQNVDQNTLVLFISDNGRPFPRCKTTLYDSGIKTPLLVRWPDRIKSGSICESLTSAVDLAPTFLELAGLEPPATAQGRSFVGLLTDPAQRIRDFIFAEHNWHDYDALGRAVRSARFKYIRNFDLDLPNTPPADAVRSPTFQTMIRLRDAGQLTDAQRGCFTAPKPEEELYDLQADPYELHNLAGDPVHAKTLTELREQLGQWRRDTQDPTPGIRSADEFDRETGQPLANRQRPRKSKRELIER